MGQTATGHFDGAGTGVDPAGSHRVLRAATAPVAGTDEVQTLTIGGTPTGGTFKLKFQDQITAAITWSATNATLLANIDAALEALPGIGTGNIAAAAGSLTAGIGTVTLTFGGALAKRAVPLITVFLNSLTGTSPTLAIAETTPGVNATYRGVGKGRLIVAEDTGVIYRQAGTTSAPTWTEVGDAA
jgi:hypothetical protein